MLKMQSDVKDKMFEDIEKAKNLLLKDKADTLSKESRKGILFHFEDWGGAEDRSKIIYQEDLNYALMDILFVDYINNLESSNDEYITNDFINNFDETSKDFHEYIRSLAFFRFADSNITTIQEAILEFKKINFFPPTIVIKDGQIIDISHYFDNVVYF